MGDQKQPTLTQRITALKKQSPQQHDLILDLLALCGAFIQIKGSQEYPDPEKFRFVAISAIHANHNYDSRKLSLENVYDMINYYRHGKGNINKTKNKFNHLVAMITLKMAKEIKGSDLELKDTENPDIEGILNTFYHESIAVVEKPKSEIPPMHLVAKIETPICFSIVHWNVQGLTKKIKINDLLNFNVIILSETHIKKEEPNKKYKPNKKNDGKILKEYELNEIKEKYSSHNWIPQLASNEGSGGMLMGVKACLQQKAIETVNPFIIAREVEINGSMHTIIGVYRRPTKSLATDNELKIELATLLDRYPDRTIVLGDLNARIGTLGNRGDPRIPRNSMDKVIDKEGREWIKFFQEHGIQILNGNKDGDWQGKLTRPNKREQRPNTKNSPGTVIDYAGATEQVFEDIKYFKVISMEESDHDQITIIWDIKQESGDRRDITLETEVNIAQLERVQTHEDAWKFINQFRKFKDKDSPTDEDFFEHFRGLMKGTTEKHDGASDDDPSTDFEIRAGESEDAMSLLQEDLEAKQDKDGLLATFKNCLKGKSIPDDWRVTKIYPVHAKGVKTYLDSYQGIHKTNINYKIWAHVLSRRLTDEIDRKISSSRWKLHKARSAIDSRYILNSFIQESILNRKKLSVLFIDLRKALQSVDRNRLWENMKKMEIKEDLINCCKDIYKTTPMQIRETENQFYTTNGLKQNCPLSPILLALYIGFLNKDTETLKRQRKRVLINCIPYYDDMVVIAIREHMNLVMGQVQLDNLDLTADDMEFVVFSDSGRILKTDKMCKWNGTLVKVENFHTCFGFTFQSNGDFTEHIQHQASEANRMLRLVYDLGKEKDVKERMKMFDCLLKPGLMCGSELFGWKQYKALEDVQVRYLKWVLGLDMDVSDHKELMHANGALPLYIDVVDKALRYELRANPNKNSFLYDCIRKNQKAQETNRRNYMAMCLKWTVEDEQRAMEKHKDNPMGFCQEVKERHVQIYKRTVLPDKI